MRFHPLAAALRMPNVKRHRRGAVGLVVAICQELLERWPEGALKSLGPLNRQAAHLNSSALNSLIKQ